MCGIVAHAGRRSAQPILMESVARLEYRGYDSAGLATVNGQLRVRKSVGAFHRNHAILARQMARAVTDHATPISSGTVARTKRIPIEQRAEAAVIAWMRHKTTGYDGMVIPRIKGKRGEVRRMLGRRSHELLERYRRGAPVPDGCLLQTALAGGLSAQTDLSSE